MLLPLSDSIQVITLVLTVSGDIIFLFLEQQKDDQIQLGSNGREWRRRWMERTISSSSLNRYDYISEWSGGPQEGRRQEVTLGERGGGQIMTSSKTELQQSR